MSRYERLGDHHPISQAGMQQELIEIAPEKS
jgi:hypothetical protein